MKENIWISEKGVRYILHPKRGAWSNINPDVCMALTAKGQNNWIGTFISPNIDHIEREPVQGGVSPVKIVMKDGNVYWFDGERFSNNSSFNASKGN